MKIYVNAAIKKAQIIDKIKYDLKGPFYVMERFCDRTFDLITTLTLRLKNNFCAYLDKTYLYT